MGDSSVARDSTFPMDPRGAGAQKLRQLVSSKVAEFGGNLTDDVLTEYIVVLVAHGKQQAQAATDLEAFLGEERSRKFCKWLWEHLSANRHLYLDVEQHQTRGHREEERRRSGDRGSNRGKSKATDSEADSSDSSGSDDSDTPELAASPLQKDEARRQSSPEKQRDGSRRRAGNETGSNAEESRRAARDVVEGSRERKPEEQRQEHEVLEGRPSTQVRERRDGRGERRGDKNQEAREHRRKRDTGRESRGIQEYQSKEQEIENRAQTHGAGSVGLERRQDRTLQDVQPTKRPAGLESSAGQQKRLRSVAVVEPNCEPTGGPPPPRPGPRARPRLAGLGPHMAIAVRAAAEAAEEARLAAQGGKVGGSIWDRLGRRGAKGDERKIGNAEDEQEPSGSGPTLRQLRGRQVYVVRGKDSGEGTLSGDEERQLEPDRAEVQPGNEDLEEGNDRLHRESSKKRSRKDGKESGRSSRRRRQHAEKMEKVAEVSSEPEAPTERLASAKRVRPEHKEPSGAPASHEANGNTRAEPEKAAEVEVGVEEMKRRMRQVQLEMLKLKARQEEVARDLQKTVAPSVKPLVKAPSQEDIDARTIFVSNVHFAATKEALSVHFGSCGQVQHVVTLTDPATGRSKGCAYVEFAEPSAVERALVLNESLLLSRALKVVPKSGASLEVISPRPVAAITPRRGHIKGRGGSLSWSRPAPATSLHWKRPTPAKPSVGASQTSSEQDKQGIPTGNGRGLNVLRPSVNGAAPAAGSGRGGPVRARSFSYQRTGPYSTPNTKS